MAVARMLQQMPFIMPGAERRKEKKREDKKKTERKRGGKKDGQRRKRACASLDSGLGSLVWHKR